jgi:hypothetical protein
MLYLEISKAFIHLGSIDRLDTSHSKNTIIYVCIIPNSPNTNGYSLPFREVPEVCLIICLGPQAQPKKWFSL